MQACQRALTQKRTLWGGGALELLDLRLLEDGGEHAGAIVTNLTDTEWSGVPNPEAAALTEEVAALTKHAADALVAKLNNSETPDVRRAAVETLGKLDAALLAEYAGHIDEKRHDLDEGVRKAAEATLGKLEEAILAEKAVLAEQMMMTRTPEKSDGDIYL